MKLKYKYIALFSACALSVLTGCEDLKFGNAFLEKPLGTDMTIDSVFSRKVYADQALAEVYHSLPDYLPSEGRLAWNVLEVLTDLGDGVKPGGVGGYYDGMMTASSKVGNLPYRLDIGSTANNDEAIASGPMYGIRKAWIYIENVDRVVDMSAEEKTIRKAEAKTIIAYHYSQMLRHYGGMPWIDHAYKPDEDMKCSRMTVEEMVNKTVELLDETSKILPWSVEADDDGRMTAAAALALKTRVLLFAASPLLNNAEPHKAGVSADQRLSWYGDYKIERWQRALDAGLEFMRENKKNGNFYDLVDNGDPRSSFAAGYFDRYNKETIISGRRFVLYNTGSKSLQQIKFGNGGTTGNYADMFEMADGTEFSWDNPVHAKNPFFDVKGKPVRDIRMYETLFVNEDQFQGRKAEIWIGGRESCDGKNSVFQKNAFNGYGMRKFQRDLKGELSNKFYSCPLIRLPEVYLNIAEAMNELGKATTKDEFGNDAYDYVNIVRSRVDMPNLNRTKHTPGVNLREAILHERAIEFGYEEVRYFDINRWKRSDLLKKTLYRLTVKSADKGKTSTYELDYDMVNKRVWIERWDDRYYLLPIPQDEINKKYGLVQNAGWE